MFRRSCPESIEVSTRLSEQPAWAVVDPTQLQTAILNLAVNARDAMPAGGRLTIATQREPRRGRAPVGPYVGISVADTGCGMPAEVQARAFEPFFTTKGIGRGTGLGLSMVASAMRQMNGEVKLESQPGKGTIVRLLVPAADDTAIEATQVGTTLDVAEAPVRTIHVLYVEDDKLVSAATVDMLEREGYAVHAASDAVRALALLEANPAIELMITDVGLPGMNGHELAAAARRARPELRVLFLTGYDRSGVVAGAATQYLGKPYRQRELFGALRQLVE
jgi:CheY-like chemotaxis protein